MTRTLLRVAFAGLLGTLAGFGFGPVFGGVPGRFLVGVVAVAAAGSLVAAAAALVPRLPATVAALGGAAVVVLVAVLASASTVDIIDGPWRLLTGALPTESAGPELASVLVVTGWCTLAAGLLAAYTTHPLAPLPPVLVGLAAALGLGASGRPLPVWYAVVAVALVAGLLVAGRAAPPTPAALGAAGTVAVIAVVTAGVLGPVAPGTGRRAPADVRDLVAGPVQPRSGVSPLQEYLALRNNIRPIRVTGTVSRPGSLLRMATLTEFDGTYWTVAGDYRRAGTTLPSRGAGSTVTQRVRVEAGELDWLLTAGRPTSVSVPGLGVDEATGDVTVPLGTAPPAEYVASSRASEAGADEILAADPVPPDRAVPAPPPQIRSFLDTAVAQHPPGPDQLLALYRQFTVDGGFRYDQAAEAAGGHGYFQIQRLLTSKRGTSEQYASAYAAMARHLGYDARVVMGFRPRYDREAFTVTGPDVDAWVEVNLAGPGWVGIDPSPRDNPVGPRPDAAPAPARTRPLDDPLKTATRTPPARPPDSAEAVPGGGDPSAARPGGTPNWPAILAAMLLAALAGATPAAKATRRWRRRRRTGRLAILGAWCEIVDRLREYGLPLRATLTTGEVVGLVATRLPAAAPGLADLASTVDRAAYAPEEPPPAQRGQAWATADDVRHRVRASLPPVRRAAALLDPRALFSA